MSRKFTEKEIRMVLTQNSKKRNTNLTMRDFSPIWQKTQSLKNHHVLSLIFDQSNKWCDH